MQQPKVYGLIGYPLSHSFSKKYFTEKFERENISDASYELFPLEDISMLPDLLNNYPNLAGLNVTTPYKVSVIPFLNELDPVAKAVGAVNCIRFELDPATLERKLVGYNTDVFGFRQSIKPFLETQHERALIIGTGGGSKAVNHVLKEIGIDCYFLSRNRAQLFVNDGAWLVFDKIFEYEELNEYIIQTFKLIINTSPVGMFPYQDLYPLLPYEAITPSHLLYDLIYNPAQTEFLRKGKEQGATTINGLSMLHQQAEEAWRVWNR